MGIIRIGNNVFHLYTYLTISISGAECPLDDYAADLIFIVYKFSVTNGEFDSITKRRCYILEIALCKYE